MGLGSRNHAAMFSPQKTASALKNGKITNPGEPPRRDPEPTPDPSEEKSRTRAVQVMFDAGDVISGLVQAARFVDGYRRRKRREREESIDKAVLGMARAHKGFVGVFDLLMTETCDREEALASFSRLQGEQHCQWLCDYENEPLYIFPTFLVRVWVCAHCDSRRLARPQEWLLEKNLCQCCGAQLTLEIE